MRPRSTLRSTLPLLVLCALVLAACAPGANPLRDQAGDTGKLAGFWLGLWHGAIAWITFIVSLFDARVSVYEVHNSGWPYNLGFLFGAGAFHGGGASARKRKTVITEVRVAREE